MASVITELQQNALDPKFSVTDLVRKASVVARKLGAVEFQSWAEKELNGYSGCKNSEVPEYRETSGNVMILNPYRGYQPVFFPDSKTRNQFALRKTSQSVSELEAVLESDKHGQLQMHYPAEVERILMKAMGAEMQPSLHIDSSSIKGILDRIRNNVLDWAIKLEEQGIVGENLTFSSNEKTIAQHVTYNINNYASIHAQNISQGDNSSQTNKNIFSWVKEIELIINEVTLKSEELGLGKDKSDELSSEIKTVAAQLQSPKPKKSIIKSTLSSIKDIIAEATKSALTNNLSEKITQAINLLS